MPRTKKSEQKLNNQNYYAILSSLKERDVEKIINAPQKNATVLPPVEMETVTIMFSECNSKANYTAIDTSFISIQDKQPFESTQSIKSDLCDTKVISHNRFLKSNTECLITGHHCDQAWGAMNNQTESHYKQSMVRHLDKACDSKYPGTRWNGTYTESLNDVVSDMQASLNYHRNGWREDCKNGEVIREISVRNRNAIFHCAQPPQTGLSGLQIALISLASVGGVGVIAVGVALVTGLLYKFCKTADKKVDANDENTRLTEEQLKI